MPARYVIDKGMFVCTEHETRTVFFFVPAEGMNLEVVAQIMNEHNATHDSEEATQCPQCMRQIPKIARGGDYCPYCGAHKKNFSESMPVELWHPLFRKSRGRD